MDKDESIIELILIDIENEINELLSLYPDDQLLELYLSDDEIY